MCHKCQKIIIETKKKMLAVGKMEIDEIKQEIKSTINNLVKEYNIPRINIYHDILVFLYQMEAGNRLRKIQGGIVS